MSITSVCQLVPPTGRLLLQKCSYLGDDPAKHTLTDPMRLAQAWILQSLLKDLLMVSAPVAWGRESTNDRVLLHLHRESICQVF